MPTYIPKDFSPSDDTITALKKDGIVQAFLDQYVTKHFGEYWNELKDDKNQKGRKTAWQTTYRNWARSAFRGRLGRIYEENMHNRSGYGKSKPNLFQEVAGKMIAEDLEVPAKPTPKSYRLPDPPSDTGETMTQDQAFEKLNQMFGRKS